MTILWCFGGTTIWGNPHFSRTRSQKSWSWVAGGAKFPSEETAAGTVCGAKASFMTLGDIRSCEAATIWQELMTKAIERDSFIFLLKRHKKSGELGYKTWIGSTWCWKERGICLGIDLFQALEIGSEVVYYILPWSYDMLLNETPIQVRNGNKTHEMNHESSWLVQVPFV